MKNILLALGLILFTSAIFSCAEKKETKANEREAEVVVVNFDDKQALSDFIALKLDDTHPNLLDPAISKTDYKAVLNSWSDLHQRIGNHLAENRFSWGIEDSSIAIVQKIYFSPGGDIETYFFNVRNDQVTPEKKEEFAALIADFAATNRIDFQREDSFAQCGKTRYLND